MCNDLRPRCCKQGRCYSVSGSEGASNHNTVKHGDEEDLGVEEGAKSVDKGVPPFAPLHLPMEHGDVVPKRSRRTIASGFVSRDTV